MSNKKENAVPGVIRVYRKLRFVLIPVVILVMGFSAYQVIRIFAEYGEGIKELTDMLWRALQK